jgi:hypothetical protein
MSYRVDLRQARQGYDRVHCWVQARAGVIPAAVIPAGVIPVGEVSGMGGAHFTAVLTMQQLDLTGSDDYGPLHSMYSKDGGETWSLPVMQKPFERETLCHDEYGPVERVVCDFTPQWHAASHTLLGTGHTAQYSNRRVSAKYPRVTPYATYNSDTHSWNPPRELVMPEDSKFHRSGAGCTQRVDLENGEILLPIYFGGGQPLMLWATVVRCAFDGETLEYIEHGDELTCPVPRGFAEPSLVQWNGRFFLTLRNDVAGYVTSSSDGLHFDEPVRWCFDNGTELGNYNTQQHWVSHKSGLYLAYTRRGLDNDYVMRNRAPIMMAQVDTERLCILRETEREVIPNRGARLGNFGVTQVSKNEVWIVETEWMQNFGPSGEKMKELLRQRMPANEVERLADTPNMCAVIEEFGANNSVWTARLLWESE